MDVGDIVDIKDRECCCPFYENFFEEVNLTNKYFTLGYSPSYENSSGWTVIAIGPHHYLRTTAAVLEKETADLLMKKRRIVVSDIEKSLIVVKSNAYKELFGDL